MLQRTDTSRAPDHASHIDVICWLDFESRSTADIKAAGAYRYAVEADAIIAAYAIGHAPVHAIAVRDFTRPLCWSDMPDEFHEHYARVLKGEAIFAAWNAQFDRAIWNYATVDFPPLEPHHIIDVMAQAAAAGLPSDLSSAAQMSKSILKNKSGKALIKLFCTPDALATPQSHPLAWEEFRSYAGDDIAAMRSIYLCTDALKPAEWREYWAMEQINDRGVHVDLPMVERAAAMAIVDRKRSSIELSTLTGGAVTSVTQVKRIATWLFHRMSSEARGILERIEAEVDEDGNEVTLPKLTLNRKRVERLIALAEASQDREARRVLQIRLYGGASTPAKFAKILAQEVDGALFGQYVFNGAGQTGRASSRGVQVHNLARDALEAEPELLDAIGQGADYDQFAATGDDTPVARKLSLLIRPTFIPHGDNVFVWSDWSQIEARVLPWLCNHYAGARSRLQIFRDVDADPGLPDLYTRTAATLSHVPIEQVTKPMRQRGKVAELALGYCGGVGALQNMAAGYGMHFSDGEAKQIVDAWRLANPWAVNYSRELWDAMLGAKASPGHKVKAGRVSFTFKPLYLGGTLICELPSGRCLTYRALRREMVDVKDISGTVIDRRLEMTFARGYGRQKLWPGMFSENVTQAVAADFLRGTLVRLEDEGFCVRGHTHDECLVETNLLEAAQTSERLREVMQRGFDWSEGLPLMSEESIAFYYTKHSESTWHQ
jgi:DNA polymerase bacteriophage-type